MTLFEKPFILEELELQDAESLCQIMVANYDRFKTFFNTTLSQNLSQEASTHYIENKVHKAQLGKEFTFGIKDPKNRSVVGLIILKELNYGKGVGELAYCIDARYQGKGWTTQGVKHICDYAFSTLSLNRLRILVHHTNKGSLKVARKSGFCWKTTLIGEYAPLGSPPMDMEMYELLKKDKIAT